MHLEYPQDCDGTEHGQHDANSARSKQVACDDSNACGKNAHQGKQSATLHPARNLGMAKEFIRHHDERREKDEAKASGLGRNTQKQHKYKQSHNPETIMGSARVHRSPGNHSWNTWTAYRGAGRSAATSTKSLPSPSAQEDSRGIHPASFIQHHGKGACRECRANCGSQQLDDDQARQYDQRD
jgi:hypothetical protein